MNTAPTTCALGIAPETLSALRDDLLPRDDAARLGRHIPTCAACQRQMHTYDLLASALRAQRVPQRRAELWRGLGHARSLRAGQQQMRRWSGLGAIGAVLIAVLIFALLAHRGTTTPPVTSSTSTQPTATQQSTPTVSAPPTLAPITNTIASTGSPIPGPQLQWQMQTLPKDYQLIGVNAFAFAVAPSEPMTAYLCNEGLTNPFRFFVTHDGAASWSEPGTVQGLVDPLFCTPIVDDNNARQVIIGGHVISHEGSAYVTRDGGASWQRIRGITYVQGYSSWGNIDYVWGSDAGPSNGVIVLHLYASHDGMQSWQRIDAGIEVPRGTAWVSPYDGSIIIADQNDLPITGVYWRSTDGGQHWQIGHAPGALQFAVPMAAGQWRLCTSKEDAIHLPASATFICSKDGGKTWTAYPPLTNVSPFNGVSADAVAPDGTLYAYVVSTANTSFRLLPGATRWQSLGPDIIQSGSTHFYRAPNGGGVYWDMSSNKGPQNEVATALG